MNNTPPHSFTAARTFLASRVRPWLWVAFWVALALVNIFVGGAVDRPLGWMAVGAAGYLIGCRMGSSVWRALVRRRRERQIDAHLTRIEAHGWQRPGTGTLRLVRPSGERGAK